MPFFNFLRFLPAFLYPIRPKYITFLIVPERHNKVKERCPEDMYISKELRSRTPRAMPKPDTFLPIYTGPDRFSIKLLIMDTVSEMITFSRQNTTTSSAYSTNYTSVECNWNTCIFLSWIMLRQEGSTCILNNKGEIGHLCLTDESTGMGSLRRPLTISCVVHPLYAICTSARITCNTPCCSTKWKVFLFILSSVG